MTALIALTLKWAGNNNNNPYLNVFGYKSNLIIVDEMNQFLDGFVAQILPTICAVLHNSTYLISASAVNTGNEADFVERSYLSTDHPGGEGNEAMPPFVAWKFQLVRAVRGKRSGYKRFGPISEADTANGLPASGIVTGLNNVATKLKAPITVGIIETWFPVILERPRGAVTTWNFHDFSRALATGVTTQNTRKR